MLKFDLTHQANFSYLLISFEMNELNLLKAQVYILSSDNV